MFSFLEYMVFVKFCSVDDSEVLSKQLLASILLHKISYRSMIDDGNTVAKTQNRVMR